MTLLIGLALCGPLMAVDVNVVQVSTGTVEVDPTTAGNAAFTVDMGVHGVFPSGILARFEDIDRPGTYWDGEAWTSDAGFHTLQTNTHPFWVDSSRSLFNSPAGGNVRVDFQIQQPLFTPTFWQGAREQRVRITLGIPSTPNYFAAPFELTFKEVRPGPRLFDTGPSLQVDRSDSEPLTLKLSFFMEKLNPEDWQVADLSWAWRLAGSNTYWDGSQWVASEVFHSLDDTQTRAGFFDNTVVDKQAGTLTAYFQPDAFTDAFWQGQNPTIELVPRYLNKTEYLIGNPIDLPVVLKPSQAPAALSFFPENWASSRPTIWWEAVEGAESYRLGIMRHEDRVFLDLDWENVVITQAAAQVPEALELGKRYRLYVYSVNRAGKSTHVRTRELAYLPPEADPPTTAVAVTPAGDLIEARPTFTWSPVKNAKVFFVGLRDSRGHWLDPDWRQNPLELASYQPDRELELGETYEIVMMTGNYLVRSPEVVVGTVRRTGDASQLSLVSGNLEAPDSLTGSGSGDWDNYVGLTADFSTGFPNSGLNESDLQFFLKNDRGEYWNGSDWIDSGLSGNLWLSLTDQREGGIFDVVHYHYDSATSSHLISLGWMGVESLTRSECLPFWRETLNEVQLGVRYTTVTGARDQIDVPIQPGWPVTARDFGVAWDDIVGVTDAFSPTSLSLTVEVPSVDPDLLWWLWRDEDTGELWNGQQWVPATDQPPWTQVLGPDKAWWPGLEVDKVATGNNRYRLDGSYRLSQNSGLFFNDRVVRNIRVFVKYAWSGTVSERTEGAEGSLDQNVIGLIGGGIGPIKFVDQRGFFSARVGLSYWGLQPASAEVPYLVHTPETMVPEAAQASGQFTAQQGFVAQDEMFVALGLYEPNAQGDPVRIRTSEAITLADLNTSKVGDLFRSLFLHEGAPITLDQGTEANPYYIAAFLTHDPGVPGRDHTDWQAFRSPQGWSLSLSINGVIRQPLSREDQESVLAQGVPFIYRSGTLVALQDGVPITLKHDQRADRDLLTPGDLNGRAAANHDDTLSPNWVSESGTRYGSSWKMVELDGEGNPTGAVVQSGPEGTPLKLGDMYQPGKNYRLVLSAKDRYGVPFEYIQDFGSIRSIAGPIFKFTFGDNHDHTAKYKAELTHGVHSYTSRLSTVRDDHSWKLQVLGVNGTADAEDTSRLFPGVEVDYHLKYPLGISQNHSHNHTQTTDVAGLSKQAPLSLEANYQLSACDPWDSVENVFPYPIELEFHQVKDVWSELTWYPPNGDTRDYKAVIDFDSSTLTNDLGVDAHGNPIILNDGNNCTPNTLVPEYAEPQGRELRVHLDGTAHDDQADRLVWPYIQQPDLLLQNISIPFSLEDYPDAEYLAAPDSAWRIFFFMGKPENVNTCAPGGLECYQADMALDTFLAMQSDYDQDHPNNLKKNKRYYLSLESFHEMETFTSLLRQDFGIDFTDAQHQYRVHLFISRNGQDLVHSSQIGTQGQGIPLYFERSDVGAANLIGMDYLDVTPESVTVQEGQTGSVAIEQALEPTSSTGNAAHLLSGQAVALSAFQWAWVSGTQYWSGSQWVEGATDPARWKTLGSDALPFQAAQVGLENPEDVRIRIRAEIPHSFFGPEFWDGASSRTVQLEVRYHLNETINASEAPSQITFERFETLSDAIVSPKGLNSGLNLSASAELSDPLDVLRNVGDGALRDALNRSYAPEPFVLASQDITGSATHTWVLSAGTIDPGQLTQIPTGPLPNEDWYAWLEVPFDPQTDLAGIQAFLVPYPDHLDSVQPWGNYDSREAVVLGTQANWTRAGNVFYRYVPSSTDPQKRQFQVCVFVPASRIRRNPIPSLAKTPLPQSAIYGKTDWAAEADPHHNRIISVNYPDPDDPNHKIYQVSFSDLKGYGQETRAMGSYAPVAQKHQYLVSGFATYDALGRQVSAGKGFYGTAPSGAEWSSLMAAGSRDESATAGEAFWKTSRNHIEPDQNPFTNTFYEDDPARGRVMAELPFGEKARDSDDPLRYFRYHYFSIVVGDPGLVVDLPGMMSHLVPVEDGGVLKPGLHGTLAIDPDGAVSVTLTGADADRPLLTIANPSLEWMRAWHLDVVTGEAPDLSIGNGAFTNHKVYLPTGYEGRLNNSTTNLVSYNQYDRFGRLIAVYPPRAILAPGPNGPWTLSLNDAEVTVDEGGIPSGLVTRHVHDAYDRVIETHEPEFGMSEFVYDRHGRLRFSRNAKERPAAGGIGFWFETVYDDQDRVIASRQVRFTNPNGSGYVEYGRTTLQQKVDANSSDLNQLEVTENTAVMTRFDRYDLGFPGGQGAGRLSPWTDTELFPARVDEKPHFWPTLTELEQQNPKGDPDFQFGDPIGQTVEIVGPNSAERFFYDHKGRVVCRVYLIRGVLEPQIFWVEYDNRDRVVRTINQTHHLALGYTYDAFDRLVTTSDLAPLSERMTVHIGFRKHAGEHGGEGQTTFAALGSLIDEESTLSYGSSVRKVGGFTHTPTGHVSQVALGQDSGAWLTTDYRFDVRDWLLDHQTKLGGQQAFSAHLDYFGDNGDMFDAGDTSPFRYDGTITRLREIYHLGQAGGASPEQATFDLVHRYRYDAANQLTEARSSWDQELQLTYSYDRNGNRTQETRTRAFRDGETGTYDASLDHEIPQGTNMLAYVDRDELLGGSNPAEHAHLYFDYDVLGNVTLQKENQVGESVTRNLAYGDPRFPVLPTEIDQVGTLSESERYPTVRATFAYDHSGTRVRRSEFQEGQNTVSETTYFVPAGTENHAELDDFGRIKRAYLLNGGDRIGYKSKRHAGLYVKDHLGSTRMVVAMYRNRAGESRSEPPTPACLAGDVVAAFSFNGDLTNEGTSGDGWTVDGSVPTFTSRRGDRALWLNGGQDIDVSYHGDMDDLGNAWTISLWLYDEDEDDGIDDGGTLVYAGATGDTRLAPFLFYIDDNKTPTVSLGNGIDRQWITVGNRISYRRWTHLAVTYDDQQVTAYQDGIQVGDPKAVTIGALYPAAGLTMGYLPLYLYRWHGGLDEVQVLKRAATAEEIQSAYLAGLNEGAESAPDYARGGEVDLSHLVVMAQTDMDPFGITLREAMNTAVSGNVKEPHLFTGQEKEPDFGMYYMGGRWYFPEVGRFLQVDPADQYWNPYSYVGNDPVNMVDPTGLYGEDGWFILADVVNSLGSGVASNFTNGLIDRAQPQTEFGEAAQVYGDVLSIYLGVAAITTGGGMMIGGLGLSPAGGVSLTAVPVGGALVAGGAVGSLNGAKHLTGWVVESAEDLYNSYTEGSKSTDDFVRKAEDARDEAGKRLKRKHATYVGGHKNGKVVSGCSRNPAGCAEDDVARQLGSDAKMTKAHGWRRNKTTGELEWAEIPVCKNCQRKYSPGQFPDDVKAEPGGAWGR
ncbi:RHS repeat-associated core domain-containing protein [Sulfidibacter corallicola]|uniref:LamG-like jellyroll fold domain-containing protein n=1 Tax=Sulfidibacter corallicola TaxID=2818388 RepID=A0A8A4TKV1_SULCO|nr:RHS repeat-associated core domain-containing protein [Sulfidibacter corallicola]QTD50170.1 hypothetical protein J3U87_31685 [Sulfidibacter corallicola]